MKKTILLLLLFITNILIAQKKVCESNNEDIQDPNSIQVKKCDIKESKKKARTRIIRKRVQRNIVLKNEANQLKIKGKRININSSSSKITDRLKFEIKSKEVLFDLVEEVPTFKTCGNSTRENNAKCFKSKINKHISKHFNPDHFVDNTFRSKIFIQFKIDIQGNIIDIKTKTKNKLIIKEFEKILQKIPLLKPGKEKGLPVIVSYSFPLNLTLN